MLQEFYKDTIQSSYVKYLLNQVHIPTVPFTNNIMHVTKGNTYIHEGYFVKAIKSDAVQAIREDIQSNPSLYNSYFIKCQPYIFGRKYSGLTTNYKSNSKGYDSITHYYLGEYLRAYKSYYGIDLMPFYNCYSNEYVEDIHLKELSNGNIRVQQFQNKDYKIISVPIKFCSKYTIAIQCSQEVMIAPVLIGKKGLLEDKTSQLYMINNWGKKYPRIDFNKPIVYESPHINSINDLVQSALQTYDKYLRLLIQVPLNNESSVVVLEGEYKNTSVYAEKIINTSKEDIKNHYATLYSTKLPHPNNEFINSINIPKNSYLRCNDLESQIYYLYLDNNIIQTYGENKTNPKFLKYTDDCSNKHQKDNKFNLIYDESKVEVIEEIDQNNHYCYRVPLSCLCNDLNKIVEGEGENKKEKFLIYIKNLYKDSSIVENGAIFNNSDEEYSIDKKYYYINSNTSITFKYNVKQELSNLPLDKFFSVKDTTDNPIKKISQIVRVTQEIKNYLINDIPNINKDDWVVQYKATYLNSSLFTKKDNKLANIALEYNGKSIEFKDIVLAQNSLSIFLNSSFDKDYEPLDSNAKHISLAFNNYLTAVGEDNWELISKSHSELFNFNEYLNKYLISNLNLLKFNNHISYAFSGRLIEYLVGNVICKNEMIPKNIKRVQHAINSHNEGASNSRKQVEISEDDIWSDDLRVEIFKDVQDLNSFNKYLPLYDINGFLDKDSEKLLSIKNEVIR